MLNERVQKLVEARKMLNEAVVPLIEELKDTKIPLNERWEAYTKLVENGAHTRSETYGDGFIGTLDRNMTLYDDFHVDRYQTERFIDMYDHIMEADGSYQQDLVKARETNLEAWQEKVLASGFASFTYDW